MDDYRFRPRPNQRGRGRTTESYGGDRRSWSRSYHAHFLISHHSKGESPSPSGKETERGEGGAEDNVIPSQHKKVVSRRDSCGFLWPPPLVEGASFECPSPSLACSLTDKMMDIAKTRGQRQHVALKTTLWKCRHNNDE